jgi:ATP-dependent helicase Lhr and Lhr-like helicase
MKPPYLKLGGFPMSIDSLDIFDIYTKRWFTRALGTPTAVQEAAWPAIADGKHTLVSAPTGTGKTLTAFLVFIDKLKKQARVGTLTEELHLIYISPLKSLAGDIRENLRKPLAGILEEESDSGFSITLEQNLSVAIRTGDTTQSERRSMIKHPPHILITTPESLYLMLTSKSGQSILRTAKALIIDELHALIDSKRGAHLMLSIARLDKLCENPVQRIGLSATIEPLKIAAEYLSPDSVTIVAPKMQKNIEIEVISPVADAQTIVKNPVWQEVGNAVYEHSKNAKSVIAFVEGRAYSEKLAYYVNQFAGEGFARTHHGSLSKEHRLGVEQALRDGELRLLCATSSMELGIDVGDIEKVFQIGCPRSISSTLQRLGRAGHNPNRTSVMQIFTRTAVESLYSGLTAKVVKEGGIEHANPPKQCLDVLAQHLVSMATGEGYDVEDVLEILTRSYTFRDVTKEDVRSVLCMLAGDYEHDRNIPVRPRVLYDRIHDHVIGDPYSRMLAISAAGTIPDKGELTVKTENGVKLGELDEEFVFESRKGDRFLLGTFAWQISSIQKDTVIVTPTSYGSYRLPFWKGEPKGRRLQTGLAFGSIFRKLNHAYYTETLLEELNQLGLSESAAQETDSFITRQIEATGVLPDDHTIIIEHFKDETGNHQMMVHSIFGRQVNAPLAILVREALIRKTKSNINSVDDDDGFLLFPYDGIELPEGILQSIKPETARPTLEAILPSTPLFNITFRYNAGNALMMGVRKTGRQPLWVQRMRSAEMLDSIVRNEKHPLIRETKRECLEDYWDLSGVEYVLEGIQSGLIQIRELNLLNPSPMSFTLRQQTEASMMYNYAPTPIGIHKASEDALNEMELIPPDPEHLAGVSERRRLPEDENQLHSLLMIEGDLIAGELDIPIDWLENLTHKEQALYIEPGLWIAAEHNEKYVDALNNNDVTAMKQIILRLLRYRGAWSLEQVADRYFLTEEIIKQILTELCNQGNVVESNGLFYHSELYERARQETVKFRRKQIKTLPSERYAAMLASRIRTIAPPSEQLERALKSLSDQFFSANLWESVLLPSRVTGYRPELLDTLLSQGNMVWSFQNGNELSFHPYEDIDWDTDLSEICETLEGNEKILYDALLKRGASFMQRLTSLIDGISPYDVLLSLLEKGLVCADSFMPVRSWLNHEKLEKGNVKVRASARAKAMTNGRWEVTRPRIEQSLEQQLERIFDHVVIVSRETIGNLSWLSALEILRVWEYTGRVRRGYFIEGLSGIQFIREKDFTYACQLLEQPSDEIVWLSAVDPANQWGKSIPHKKDLGFMNIPGTVVALHYGLPVAVLERQGKVLRVFDESVLPDVMNVFALDYSKKRIFPSLNRVVIKQYPEEAMEALVRAGFRREMQDYVFYRG